MLSRHPQVAQRKPRQHLRAVLKQTSVAHLRVTELAFDHPKRMFHGCMDRRFDVFDLFGQVAQSSMPLTLLRLAAMRHLRPPLAGACFSAPRVPASPNTTFSLP